MTRRDLAPIAAVMLVAGCALFQPTVEPKSTPDIESPVEGVVLSVDSAGLGDVRGFTLRPASSPFSFTFELGALEDPTEFPPGHLAEHQATSQPVRVYFRTEDGVHIAYRLEDAAP